MSFYSLTNPARQFPTALPESKWAPRIKSERTILTPKSKKLSAIVMSSLDQVSLVGNSLVPDPRCAANKSVIGKASETSEFQAIKGQDTEQQGRSGASLVEYCEADMKPAQPMTFDPNAKWVLQQATSCSSVDLNLRDTPAHNRLKEAKPQSHSVSANEMKALDASSNMTGVNDAGNPGRNSKWVTNPEFKDGTTAYKRNNSSVNGQGLANHSSKLPTNTGVRGDPAVFKNNKRSASSGVPRNWNTKWATATELRGDSTARNKNKDWQVESDVRSDQADYGQDNAGVRLGGGDQNYQLADWEGNWAPAPIEWEERGSYTDPLVVERIKEWKKREIADTDPIDIGLERATIEGEITPRSWVPKDIDGLEASIWWDNHLRSPEVPLNAKPWWLYFATSSSQHIAVANVPDARLDPTDNDMGKATRQTSEHSILTLDNKQLRQAVNVKKLREQQRAAAKEAASYVPAANKYAPRINIYLRPAMASDVPQITDIYNHYIANTVYCPELEPLTTGQVRDRWTDVTDNKLPFLVAVDASSKGNRRHGQGGPGRAKVEHILGFAFADDYNDVRGMYRYTVEVEMFTKSGHSQKGIGRSMMDKLMVVLDPHYTERGGYEFDGDAMQYGSGGRRVVGSIVINIPYDAADKKRLAWLQEWLSQWDFQKTGELSEVGHKVNTIVSQAIFIKKTGSTIQPWAL